MTSVGIVHCAAAQLDPQVEVGGVMNASADHKAGGQALHVVNVAAVNKLWLRYRWSPQLQMESTAIDGVRCRPNIWHTTST